MNNDRFIPFRKQDIISMLAQDLPKEQNQASFLQFCQLLSSVVHHDYHQLLESLKCDYAPFDPNADTRSLTTYSLTQRNKCRESFANSLAKVLNAANFEKITEQDLQEALTEESLFKVRLEVDFEDFEQVVFYRRGESTKHETLTSFWGLKKQTINFTHYDRVAVFITFKNAEHFQQKGKTPLGFEPSSTIVKLFQNVPKADLEMLFPNSEVRMRPIDKAIISGSAIIGGAVVLVTKLGASILLLAALFAFWFGWREESVEMTQQHFIDFEYNIHKEYSGKLHSLELLPARPIYLAFSDTKRGKTLAQIYDREMLKLRDSGELKKLYTDDYEHAGFAHFQVNKPTIIIKTDDANLHRAKGAENLHSLEAGLYRLILSQLTQFNIEFVKIDSHSADNLLTEQQCFANKIYTLTRAEQYYFSKPFALYTGARLFSMKPLEVEQEIELADFIKSSNLHIGVTPSLLYSAPLMKELEQLPHTNIVEASIDVFAQLKELKAGKFDVKLAYPADVNSHWQFIGEQMPYSYSIKGMPPFAIGHVMCHQDEINQQFIEQLNRVLETLYQSQAYYNLLRQAAIGSSDSDFEQYFRTGFNLDNQ